MYKYIYIYIHITRIRDFQPRYRACIRQTANNLFSSAHFLRAATCILPRNPLPNACSLIALVLPVYTGVHMGWLRLVGSSKLQVFLEEHRLFYRALLQKRPVILRSLLIVATPEGVKKSRIFWCMILCVVFSHPKFVVHDIVYGILSPYVSCVLLHGTVYIVSRPTQLFTQESGMGWLRLVGSLKL